MASVRQQFEGYTLEADYERFEDDLGPQGYTASWSARIVGGDMEALGLTDDLWAQHDNYLANQEVPGPVVELVADFLTHLKIDSDEFYDRGGPDAQRIFYDPQVEFMSSDVTGVEAEREEGGSVQVALTVTPGYDEPDWD